MKEVIEIIKIILPAVIVFLTAFYFLKAFFKNEEKKLNLKIVSKNQDIITPLRLQAYERLVLFLERINPESLIIRTSKSSITAKEYEKELLSTIRTEFEHNLSQQIFVSSETWERVKKAKADVISIIHFSAQYTKEDDPAINLSAKILENTVSREQLPVATALSYLKEELKIYF